MGKSNGDLIANRDRQLHDRENSRHELRPTQVRPGFKRACQTTPQDGVSSERARL
jgi:hypothetical protein